MQPPAAFILAAGLGTRLAPLTELLPKPLIPVFHKPLLTFALDSLIASGFGPLSLNTHYLPEAFEETFGKEPSYRSRSLRLFHEPLLLDTGGGIRNARSALGEGTFLVYNGDILGDLPLKELLAQHRSSGCLATLLLRPSGGKPNVRFESGDRSILDLRGELGATGGIACVYSGIALFEPEIFRWIAPEGPCSLIDTLLLAMREGKYVGGMLCKEGFWIDLGTPEAYIEAHRIVLDPAHRPSYDTGHDWPQAIHPESRVEDSATLSGMVSVGPGAVVGKNALIRDSILWPGSVIAEGASLEGCIVRGDRPVVGSHRGGIL
jgi:NDP-sugar pyrophosphorylase family protein